MATRTVITGDVAASPDHNHTRIYKSGEQHTIGSYLMPQLLSTQLVAMGKATEDSTAVNAANIANNAVLIHMFDADGPETIPYDTADPRWTAHNKTWHRDG